MPAGNAPPVTCQLYGVPTAGSRQLIIIRRHEERFRNRCGRNSQWILIPINRLENTLAWIQRTNQILFALGQQRDHVRPLARSCIRITVIHVWVIG